MIFRILEFYRLSDLECPDFVGTTGLGCCIRPCFLVMFATGTYFLLLVGIGALESCGTREWSFRGIYKGGLWEDDLHVSARLLSYYYPI